MSKTLQDVADIYYGKSQNGISDKFGHYPIIGTSGVLGKAKIALFNGPAIVVGRKGTLDNPIYVQKDFWAVDTTYAVIPKENIHSKWLYYCLKNLRLDLLNEATGVPSISRDRLYNVPIPEIDYFEQSRIAYVLDTIDEAISKTEAVIAKLKKIREGILHDLLTYGLDEYGQIRDPVAHPEQFKDSSLGRIPRDWEEKHLGIWAKFRSGYAFKDKELSNSGWKVVRITNLHRKDFPFWYYSGRIKENWIVTNGDLLFSWAGVASSIDVIIYNGEKALLNQHIYNLKIDSNVEKLFIYNYLRKLLPTLRLDIQGGAGQLHLSKEKIEKILLPNPSDEELRNIVNKIDLLDSQIDNECYILSKLNKMKSGLQNDLLTGQT